MFNNLIIEQEHRLRPKSNSITIFEKERIKQVCDLLLGTLRLYDIGYAISAPQLGIYERIILIDVVNPYIVRGKLEEAASKAIFMLNPIIIKESKDTGVLKESCLSFPKEERDIVRPNKIVVKYQNTQGIYKQARLAGIEARCVYHEIDHLDGKLIIDYI
jgi:peptide deformylase